MAFAEGVGGEGRRREHRNLGRRRHTNKSSAVVVHGRWIIRCVRRRNLRVDRHDWSDMVQI